MQSVGRTSNTIMFDQNSMNKWLSNVAKESSLSVDDLMVKATSKKAEKTNKNKPHKGIKESRKGKL